MSAANPTYADVVAMLNTLVPTTDENINDAPHQAFWRTLTRDAFVNFDTSVWGIAGPSSSPAIRTHQISSSPCPGSPRSTATSAANARHQFRSHAHAATPDDLTMVAAWIKNGAPA